MVKLTDIYNGIKELYIGKELPPSKTERILLRFKAFGYELSYRAKCVTGFSAQAIKHLREIFGAHSIIDNFDVIAENGKRYHIDNMSWIFKKDGFEPTEYINIMENVLESRMYAYTRGRVCSFGVGDMLFDIENEDEELYYQDWGYCLQYLYELTTALFFEGKSAFKYLLQEGISQIVPLVKRGSRLIDDREDALAAAHNCIMFWL